MSIELLIKKYQERAKKNCEKIKEFDVLNHSFTEQSDFMKLCGATEMIYEFLSDLRQESYQLGKNITKDIEVAEKR